MATFCAALFNVMAWSFQSAKHEQTSLCAASCLMCGAMRPPFHQQLLPLCEAISCLSRRKWSQWTFFFFRTKVYWVWFVVTAGKCIEQLWRVPPHKLDVNLLPTATLSEADKAGAIFHSTTRIKPYRCTTSKSTVRYTTTEQAIFEYAIIGSYVLFHFAESPTHFNCFDEHEGRIRSNTLDDM